MFTFNIKSAVCSQKIIHFAVEEWLNELSKAMKHTLQQLLVECLRDINANKNDLDPLKYPSQILCLAEAIEFTKNCEKSIKSKNLNGFLSDLKDQLDSYTSVDLNDDSAGGIFVYIF